MKRFNYIMIAFLFVGLGAMQAQEETKTESNWKKGATFTLNFSQTAMDNWAAGGQNSISGVGLFDSYANYAKDNFTWDNTLKIGYGTLKQDEQDWFKSDDKLEFSSKYGQKAANKWYYSALVDFKTQFTKGYGSAGDTDHISNFMAPAYLNVAVGMDYKPNDNFTVFISPITGKMTFVNDTALANAGAFGVDAGDKFRAELGAYAKIAYKVELMENVNYSTQLGLFSNYMNNPQNVDINWDNLVTFKINKYLNASLIFNMIYDDDIKFEETNSDGSTRQVAKLQWKEMLALGITYSL